MIRKFLSRKFLSRKYLARKFLPRKYLTRQILGRKLPNCLIIKEHHGRRAPFRDYGFVPTTPSYERESAFSTDRSISTNPSIVGRDDLSLLAGTLERLDAELQVDLDEFPNLQAKSNRTTPPSDLELLSGAMSKIATLEKQLNIANRRAQKAELQLQFTGLG